MKKKPIKKKSSPSRKIVQLTYTPGPKDGKCGLIYALCDDGTLWWRNDLSDAVRWYPEKAIPQDEL